MSREGRRTMEKVQENMVHDTIPSSVSRVYTRNRAVNPFKRSEGLYCVEHYPETANIASEELTLDQFHRRMGHISTETARKLVSQGLVTGVSLELTDYVNPIFCESCVYVKSSHKPIQKVRGGERTAVFGGKVLSCTVFSRTFSIVLRLSRDIPACSRPFPCVL